MNAVEFTTELNGESVLAIPAEFVSKLPRSGSARVIVLTEADTDDELWKRASFEQFMREDPPEDSVYDQFE
jgi:hypothetical protein